MFYLHVYLCIVHILCVKMHYYFLLNIKHGASRLYLGPKYNCQAPGEGPRRELEGGLFEAAGGGASERPLGASNSLRRQLGVMSYTQQGI